MHDPVMPNLLAALVLQQLTCTFARWIVAISALVGAITVAYNRHEKFEALKQENESFCQSMLAVHDVLKGI